MAFFTNHDEIVRAVQLRLTEKDGTLLSADAGPPTFDSEPPQQWLYDAFYSAYADNENQRISFWVGVAEVLENCLPPMSNDSAEVLKRTVNLIESIYINIGSEKIYSGAFREVVGRMHDAQKKLVPNKDLIFSLLSRQIDVTNLAILIKSADEDNTLEVSLAPHIEALQAMLVTASRSQTRELSVLDSTIILRALTMLARAWISSGSRDINSRLIIPEWISHKPITAERFQGYFNRMVKLLTKAGAPESVSLTVKDIEALITGMRPSIVAGKPRSRIPRPTIHASE
ncbi:hypothetical protein [Noviherbaspirillum pedocola]|uniref:Uncharacterized protein n=1 Tax=Noviherbaspirillum pedocola TaxID=2801341 RepID=A0A934W9Z2_9BURK|nr:hypothetical protein [Noviherbaspirillum pedocola]MBK4738928.1 hypothetical protein [Noviherbaspirillum pedocola]